MTKLGTYLILKRIWNPIDFQGHLVKYLGEGICHTLCCPCFYWIISDIGHGLSDNVYYFFIVLFQISDMVCQTMSTIFREDKSGEISLDVSYTQKNEFCSFSLNLKRIQQDVFAYLSEITVFGFFYV